MLQIMPARKVYYNLLSQIKLIELKKRTNIRMYRHRKKSLLCIVSSSGYTETQYIYALR
jgi:hypothetical protein